METIRMHNDLYSIIVDINLSSYAIWIDFLHKLYFSARIKDTHLIQHRLNDVYVRTYGQPLFKGKNKHTHAY